MSRLVLKSLLAASLATMMIDTAASAESAEFFGDLHAIVANTATYESTAVEIKGEAAQALFKSVVALSRVETINSFLRRAVGTNVTCFEHFAQLPFEEPIYYTCEFIVQPGGAIHRPAIN